MGGANHWRESPGAASPHAIDANREKHQILLGTLVVVLRFTPPADTG